ncbi:endonuclease domain-containing protein [Subtercola sp. YIM 133946]|uniref:endonuclease domain-containing protein n=1 Tax=Subtercola sp. YIM 133946 TaxID=3118909 RepID=UPI002F92B433
MRRREPLPASLRAAGFSVAEARAVNVGRARLRNHELVRPFHGVRAEAHALVSPIAAFAPRLRADEWFSHESAARLWRVPLPEYEHPTDVVHVTIAAPGAASRARGVCGHQATHAHAHVVRRFGLACSDPADTWLGLAAHTDLAELVVAGDHFVLEPEVLDPLDLRPYVGLDHLRARTREFHGPGKARASAALELIRPGAESRPETLLRLLVQDARLPEPEVNPVIADGSGRRIGRADLVFRQFRVIVEYDGDQHRTDKQQYRRDVVRWQRFARNRWDVLRFHDVDLFGRPARTVAQIAEALTLGGWDGRVSGWGGESGRVSGWGVGRGRVSGWGAGRGRAERRGG